SKFKNKGGQHYLSLKIHPESLQAASFFLRIKKTNCYPVFLNPKERARNKWRGSRASKVTERAIKVLYSH
ncbi:MAG: hypothetical protein DSZ28_05820, partial [Thiothrix sp.]